TTGSGQPDRQLWLDRTGENFDLDCIAGAALEGARLASPELTDDFNLAQHHFFAVAILLRREDKIVRMPSRSERDADATPREIIDYRPFFGDADRVVQREYDTSGPDLDTLCDGGNRSARHGWVGVETTKGMKVTLRRPDRGEAVLVGKHRPFKKKFIDIAARR